MVNLIESGENEISVFIEMEQDNETSEYILPYTAQKHQMEMRKHNIIYLSIWVNEELSGFIILATKDESASVEFSRIVIASKGKGIGQLAIQAMEAYCSNHLKCDHIWLDVFKSNQRGQHIYQKLGYKQFKSEQCDGNVLLYMHKNL